MSNHRFITSLLTLTFVLNTASALAGPNVRAKTKTQAERKAAVISLTNATGLPLTNRGVTKKKGLWQTRKLGTDGKPLGTVLIRSRKLKQGATARINETGAKTSKRIPGEQFQVPLNKVLKKSQPLKGKTIVVLVESQFIPQELALYSQRFAAYGAKVEFISRLWGQDRLRFHSHFDEGLVPEKRYMYVGKDISQVKLNSGKVAAVIAPIDVNQRLLFDPSITLSTDAVAATAKAPAVQLLKEALKNPNVVVGAFGHGAELLTPLGKLIKGARITTSPGSAVHLVNAGAKWVKPADPEKWNTHVVTEVSTKHQKNLNLVTGTSLVGEGNHVFIDAVAQRVMDIKTASTKAQ